jgi:hypothetical protein
MSWMRRRNPPTRRQALVVEILLYAQLVALGWIFLTLLGV